MTILSVNVGQPRVLREAVASGRHQANAAGLLVEPPAQQEQPRFEVVLEVGQAQRLVEAELAVGELAAALLLTHLQQLPQDAGRQAANQVFAVASYAWNAEQTEAMLVPESGLPDAAPLAPGKQHSIPSVMECLVDESLISPRRTTLKTNPPRINAATPDARHRGSGESGDWHRRLSARPIGTVVQDRAAVDLLTAWVASNPESWARIAATCGPGRS